MLACGVTGVLSVHPAGTFAGGEVWFGSVGSATSSTGTFSPTANLIYGLPFYCPEDMTVDRIGTRVTTAVASSKARVGIYAADAAKYPSSLVVDSGEFDTDTTGMKSATISQALKGSTLYYLALLVSNGTIALRSASSNAAIPALGVDNTIGAFQCGVTNAQTYGGLPSTFPSSGPAFVGGSPMLVLRRSA